MSRKIKPDPKESQRCETAISRMSSAIRRRWPAGTTSGRWKSSRPTMRRRASATSASTTPSRAAAPRPCKPSPSTAAMSANCRFPCASVTATSTPDPAIPVAPLLEVRVLRRQPEHISDQLFGAPTAPATGRPRARSWTCPCAPARRSCASACSALPANCAGQRANAGLAVLNGEAMRGAQRIRHTPCAVARRHTECAGYVGTPPPIDS